MLCGFKDYQHVTVTVSDIRRSLAFYEGLLGFRKLGRLYYRAKGGLTIDFLDMGDGAILEIFSFEVTTKPSERLPNDLQLGLRHVGLRVVDTDSAAARLKAAGVRFTLDPCAGASGARIAFFEDPDGTVLEITDGKGSYHRELSAPTRVPAAVPAGGFAFDHAAISVSSLERSLAFYRDLLGFRVLGQLFKDDGHGFTITSIEAGRGILELFSFSSPTIIHRWNPDESVLGLKHLGFLVEDVDAAADSLKAAKVPFIYEPALALGGVKTAFFEDPDVVALELIDGTCEYDE